MRLNRRSLLIAASLAAAPIPAWARAFSTGVFSHGVASGDPLPDRVVLWTRFVSPNGGNLGWEVAEDEAFARVIARGNATASIANDFCVKGDVGGLAPGRPYFYRFLSASGPSVTGRTRTAPQGPTERLTAALFSCANMPWGYFHAYGHAAAREDIDLVLHLGDYIYEVQRGAYHSAAEAVPGRIIDPVTETVSLSDYYQRYASYHADPDLLELRRLKPMSVTWDDHEIANDAWREGAGAHQTPTEGAYADRVAAAAKAYFDWMPIRRPDPNALRLYRAFDWGDLARIVLLDTRYIGRDLQLDYRNNLTQRLAEAGANQTALIEDFRALLNDPRRSVLGGAQEAWVDETLAQSKRNGQPWQVIAQQIQIGEQSAPPGLTRLIGPDISAGGRAWFEQAERFTPLDLPWNLDTWNGYPAARARFLESCSANANNALVLGGDSHNCWVNNVRHNGRIAALEFAGGSVASPGFERTLTASALGEREAFLQAGNPDLAFCDVSYRGYGAVTLTREACEAEWLAFADIRSPARPEPRISRFDASATLEGWSI